MCAKHRYVHILLLFILDIGAIYLAEKIGCKDEKGKHVDWFINYKIPTIEEEPEGSNLRRGTSYAYITAPGSASWKLSSKNILSGSMLEATMKAVYSNKEDLTYLFYNDDPPGKRWGTTVGHLKGVVAFDESTGFWLIHSIPNFADPKSYKYPKSALVNGQNILCVTFRTKELNEICNQLLFSHPNIYARGITEEVREKLDDKARTLFTKKPSFNKRAPFTRKIILKSLGNKSFTSIAKDNQYKRDLYSDVIAPELKSSLKAETWRKGSGSPLRPSCNSTYQVIDIVSVKMTVSSGRRKKHIFFDSTEDHSKWAISYKSKKKWICVADLNRMKSQRNRGGGALCFASSPVMKAFDSIIEDTEKCPARRNKKNILLLKKLF